MTKMSKTVKLMDARKSVNDFVLTGGLLLTFGSQSIILMLMSIFVFRTIMESNAKNITILKQMFGTLCVNHIMLMV